MSRDPFDCATRPPAGWRRRLGRVLRVLRGAYWEGQVRRWKRIWQRHIDGANAAIDAERRAQARLDALPRDGGD